MSEKQIISTHYPYLPLTITVRKRTETLEALLDTGFDGDVVLPPGLITNGKPPDSYVRWALADSSRVLAPAYLGTVAIEGLEDAGPFPAMICILGDVPLIGRAIANRFCITLDRGRRVKLES